jgi:hypothetical protein
MIKFALIGISLAVFAVALARFAMVWRGQKERGPWST